MRAITETGCVAVITDRKDHFKTCHFKRSVQMAYLNRSLGYFITLFTYSNKQFKTIKTQIGLK